MAAVRNGCARGSRRCLCWWEWPPRLIWFMTSTVSLDWPGRSASYSPPDSTTRRASPCADWLSERPGSAEAHYYKAWLALALDQPREAIEAIEQAKKLGYDPDVDRLPDRHLPGPRRPHE